MTSEPIEAASTGQLLRRYRKLAGLTAQELAHEVNSRYPDDTISATVVFNIEAERKTAITIPELAHFAEVPAAFAEIAHCSLPSSCGRTNPEREVSPSSRPAWIPSRYGKSPLV